MAYFRCTAVGGGSKKIIVTCDDEFAGVTISCTKGGTTLTKTCPSTSPYEVEFDVSENGTWTISATVGDTLYSTTAIVKDTSVPLSYGLDWAGWVRAGGLDPEDYDSLADVFDDEPAVRRLMLVHDSADFLINAVEYNLSFIDDFCANDTAMKWIGLCDYVCDGLEAITGVTAKFLASDYWERYLKDHVPKMTGASTPYGTAGGANQYSSGYYWYAFDRNRAQGDQAAFNANASIRLQYCFPTPICVKRFGLEDLSGATYWLKNFSFVASNDGKTWTTLATFTDYDTRIWRIHDVENDDYYLFYGIAGTTGAGGCYITTLQMYGRALKESVPKMTSNTAPYGEASASSNYSSDYPAWHGFSAGATDGWIPANGSGSGWIQYDFKKKVCAKYFHQYYYVQNRGEIAPNRPSSNTIKATNDDTLTEWDTLATGIDIPDVSGTRILASLNNDNEYRYYRVESTKVEGRLDPWLGSLNFYGKDYSEKEFEQGTTKRWIYDHGVEVMPVTIDDGNGTTITKEGDRIKMVKPSASSIDGVYVETAIDITPHNTYRMRCGDEITYSGNSRSGLLELLSYAPPHVYGGANATAFCNIYVDLAPYAVGFSVESINTNQYAEISVIDAVTQTIEEWWLE